MRKYFIGFLYILSFLFEIIIFFIFYEIVINRKKCQKPMFVNHTLEIFNIVNCHKIYQKLNKFIYQAYRYICRIKKEITRCILFCEYFICEVICIFPWRYMYVCKFLRKYDIIFLISMLVQEDEMTCMLMSYSSFHCFCFIQICVSSIISNKERIFYRLKKVFDSKRNLPAR